MYRLFLPYINSYDRYSYFFVENPLWVFDFTSDINDLFTQIESLNALDPGKETFDMSLLFDILYEKVSQSMEPSQT